MKKKTTYYDDEIDLIALFKIIWNEKIKIVLITIVLFLAGFALDYQKNENYKIKLVLERFEIKEYIEGMDTPISGLLRNKDDKNDKEMEINEKIVDKFLYEIIDYEELMLILKDTKSVKDSISELSLEQQQQALSDYSRLFYAYKTKVEKQNSYLNLELNWSNTAEAINILENTVELISNNVVESIYDDLRNELILRINLRKIDDEKRIEFLKEQSLIAKKLELALPNPKIYQPYSSYSEYTRGYIAIDKEIQIIEEREYQDLTKIQNQINSLMENGVNLINYNTIVSNIETPENAKPYSIIFTVFGLIAGIFYVLILNKIQSHKRKKKTN